MYADEMKKEYQRLILHGKHNEAKVIAVKIAVALWAQADQRGAKSYAYLAK